MRAPACLEPSLKYEICGGASPAVLGVDAPLAQLLRRVLGGGLRFRQKMRRGRGHLTCDRAARAVRGRSNLEVFSIIAPKMTNKQMLAREVR